MCYGTLGSVVRSRSIRFLYLRKSFQGIRARKQRSLMFLKSECGTATGVGGNTQPQTGLSQRALKRKIVLKRPSSKRQRLSR